MKVLRPGIFLVTIFYVLAGAATMFADIIALQPIDSQRPFNAALNGRADRLLIESTTSLASGRALFRQNPDPLAIAESMSLSKAAKLRTCLQSWPENKGGCIMTSQRDADITSSAPLIGITT